MRYAITGVAGLFDMADWDNPGQRVALRFAGRVSIGISERAHSGMSVRSTHPP